MPGMFECCKFKSYFDMLEFIFKRVRCGGKKNADIIKPLSGSVSVSFLFLLAEKNNATRWRCTKSRYRNNPEFPSTQLHEGRSNLILLQTRQTTRLRTSYITLSLWQGQHRRQAPMQRGPRRKPERLSFRHEQIKMNGLASGSYIRDCWCPSIRASHACKTTYA